MFSIILLTIIFSYSLSLLFLAIENAIPLHEMIYMIKCRIEVVLMLMIHNF